jgi:hypothetical protein
MTTMSSMATSERLANKRAAYRPYKDLARKPI